MEFGGEGQPGFERKSSPDQGWPLLQVVEDEEMVMYEISLQLRKLLRSLKRFARGGGFQGSVKRT